jgi:hypothetical protein
MATFAPSGALLLLPPWLHASPRWLSKIKAQDVMCMNMSQLNVALIRYNRSTTSAPPDAWWFDQP